MRRLTNPVESMGGSVKNERYRPHASKVRELLDERSLEAIRKVRR